MLTLDQAFAQFADFFEANPIPTDKTQIADQYKTSVLDLYRSISAQLDIDSSSTLPTLTYSGAVGFVSMSDIIDCLAPKFSAIFD